MVAFYCLIDAVHRSWVNHDVQWLYDDSLTKLIGRMSVYMALLVAPGAAGAGREIRLDRQGYPYLSLKEVLSTIG